MILSHEISKGPKLQLTFTYSGTYHYSTWRSLPLLFRACTFCALDAKNSGTICQVLLAAVTATLQEEQSKDSLRSPWPKSNRKPSTILVAMFRSLWLQALLCARLPSCGALEQSAEHVDLLQRAPPFCVILRSYAAGGGSPKQTYCCQITEAHCEQGCRHRCLCHWKQFWPHFVTFANEPWQNNSGSCVRGAVQQMLQPLMLQDLVSPGAGWQHCEHACSHAWLLPWSAFERFSWPS